MNYSKHSNNKKIKKIKSKSNKFTTLISTVFFRLLILSIILAIVVGASSVIGIANAIIDSVPEINFNNMIPKGYTSFIRDQEGNVIQELSVGDSNRIYVEIDEIPKHVRDAFVAIEDKRFYEHNGIDIKGIFRAMYINIKEGSLSEGASTITQQVIKNNVLTSDVSFERKIQEQYLAMKAEEFLTKDEILELYLNTAALAQGTLGVEAASKRYFDKDVKDLSIAEGAVLAGITQNPQKYDPVIHPQDNKDRQKVILKYMYKQGKISKTQYEVALREKVYDNIKLVNDDFQESSNYTYFVDEVIRNVISDLVELEGYSTTQATNLVYRGGLNIYITQDQEMQKIVDDEYANEENFPPFSDDYKALLRYDLSAKIGDEVKHFGEEKVCNSDEEAIAYMDQLKAEWLPEGAEIISEYHTITPEPQSSFVLIDYHNGHVKALAGGRGKKTGNSVFNRATQAERQPGSTFKVLAAYLPAIEKRGYTLAKVFDDSPYVIDMPGAGRYNPTNWYRHQKYDYWGLNSVRQGIKWSMNILAVKTIFDIGIETGFDMLKELGFTTITEQDKVLALPLGGLTTGVTLLELTNAYGAIANHGTYIEPILYTKVLNHDGSILIDKQQKTKTVMKETTSFLLTSALEDVMISGTGTTARFPGMHLTGKTGTTNQSKDLVFVGYSPYYVGGIWLGHDKPEPMYHNRYYHTYIWRNIMQRVHEGLEDKPFEMPEGITTANVCSISGKLPVAGLCDKDPRGSTIRAEYFAVGTVPTEKCDVHVKAKVCKESGLFPTEFCPEDSLEEKVFTSRLEPLNPESWDPARPPRIKDYEYELPTTMENEYCDVHTEENKGIKELNDLLKKVGDKIKEDKEKRENKRKEKDLDSLLND